MSAYGKSPLVDFTRSSKKWVWNSAGLLEEIAVDALPWSYDPATREFLGLLIEEERTNSERDNRDGTTANWTKNAGTGSATKNATGLYGVANSATTFEDTDSGTRTGWSQDISISDDSKTHTTSAYVKKDNDESRFPEIRLRYTGGTTTLGIFLQLNTKTGEVTDRSSDGGTIASYDAGDFWRVTMSLANNGTGNTNLKKEVFPAHGSTFGGAEVAATGSIVYDFGQVELNANFASSPIETAGSAVTRSADTVTRTLGEEFNSDEFSVVMEIVLPEVFNTESGNNENRAFVYSDGTNSNRVIVSAPDSNGNAILAVQSGGGSLEVNALSGGSLTAGERIRLAIRAKADDWAISLNGGAVATDTAGNMPSGLTTLRIGRQETSATRFLNGHVSFFNEIPRALTDAELQAESAL